MAYEEKIEYKLEIVPPWSIIQCRRADIVLKDGVEIARGYHRSVYAPGDDVSEAPQEVQNVAAALWTPELIEDYKEHIDPTPIEPITEEEVATTDEVVTDTEKRTEEEVATTDEVVTDTEETTDTEAV